MTPQDFVNLLDEDYLERTNFFGNFDNMQSKDKWPAVLSGIVDHDVFANWVIFLNTSEARTAELMTHQPPA